MDYSSALIDVISVARQAGAIQLKHFRSSGLKIATKENINDVVTNVDRICENLITSFITDRYPDHKILAEESGETNRESESGYTWIIDPLDGTANYSTGLPLFSVSIALQKGGETVLGVVFAPYLNELFHAVKGEGAFLNGEPIKVKPLNSLNLATISTGFPVDKATNPDNNLKEFSRVLPEVRAVRRMGSAALDISYVAAGFLQGYWEMNLHSWDIAAAELILNEAGGIMKHYRNDRNISVIAATPDIFSSLSKLIRE